jgi:two-component sensor histidine kinase
MTSSISAQQGTSTPIDSTYAQVLKLYKKDAKSALDLLESVKEQVFTGKNDNHKFYYHYNYFRILFHTKSNVDQSLHQLHSALKYAKKTEQKAGVYNKLGIVHHLLLGKIDSGMHYQIKAIQTIKKQKDQYNLTYYYLDLGKIYLSIEDYPKAAGYMEKSLDIARIKGERIDYGFSLFNTINVYKKLQDSSKVKILEEEYAKFKEGKSIQSEKAHQGTGYSLATSNKSGLLKQKITQNEAQRDTFMVLNNRLFLADAQFKDKKYKDAQHTLEQGLSFLKDSILLFKKTYFEKLKQAHLFQGNYQQALNYTDSLSAIDKSLLDTKRMNTLQELEAKYQKLEQDQQIALLNNEKQITQRNFLLALLAAGTLSLIAVGLLLYSREKTQHNKILQTKNEQINAMLTEKDLLLREIHHRVKNNLQVVSSLLNLQSNYITDNAALEAITEGKNRVISMSLIHQNLYGDSNPTHISTRKYFADLIDQLFDCYNIDDNTIVMHKNIDNVLLDVDTMIPLGLISNELISNALKHAFKERPTGNIYFTLTDQGDHLHIEIKDDGVGMDTEKFLQSRSFGNKMIQAFIQKLNATWEVENNEGTTFLIHIQKVAGRVLAA